MLMVVFGAGASYDSYPSIRPLSGSPGVESVRLPLADQLFSDREAFATVASDFPACLPIITFVRHLHANKSVEQVLESLQAQSKQNPRRHVQLAAVRHYLQFIILECENKWSNVHKGVTNYTTLLDEIESWRKPSEPVCLVTFNYDTMIEKALPTVGVEIATFNDYISSDSYKLIKLHGSVNWARQVAVPMNMKVMTPWDVTNELIKKAQGLQLTDEYRIVRERPIGISDERPLFPALAIPVVRKQEYECPSEHLVALEKCIPLVTKLLVVGWRGSEEHFLHLFSSNLKHEIQVMVVAGNPKVAEETINNLAGTGIRVSGKYEVASGGFSDFIVEREVLKFLGS